MNWAGQSSMIAPEDQMNLNNLINDTIKELCIKQVHFLLDYPKRENIVVYDWALDIEHNQDFAIWELEYLGKL